MDAKDLSKNLYYLRYKQGNQGVQSSLIVASSPNNAVLVGQAYCSRELNRRFIRVDPAIVADESILSPNTGAPEEPQDVPNNGPLTAEAQMATGGLADPSAGQKQGKKAAA